MITTSQAHDSGTVSEPAEAQRCSVHIIIVTITTAIALVVPVVY